ncbi:hypothetical protein [Nocardioides alcanivorans]|uniref:hypothetical protein n=1 Tax=Nocardioides alcanivorans TaxID=2897352 RepID=UPI001F38FC10|nr:hypothetical protein [Nocardioides alcanivorans]
MTESQDSLLLGDEAHLLHIGPHKTGTSAVQAALFEGRDTLRTHGVYVPRSRARRRKAGWAMGLAGRPAGTDVPPMRHWTDLVDEVRGVDGQRVCISNEDFGRATADQARTLVDALGGSDAHVVASVRNLDRLLPSLWQERVKAGIPDSYEDWLRVVLGDDPTPFERRDALGHHDVEAMVERWVDVVGPERFTLVVLDDNDPGDILRTFEKLLGLPAQTLRDQPAGSNRGISYAESEMVRALNAVTESTGVPRPLRARFISGGLIRGLKLNERPKPGPRGAVHPEWAWEWIRAENDRRATFVESCGVRVVGDPEKIRAIREREEIGDDYVPHIPVETMGEAAAEMLRVAIKREQDALEQVAKLEKELAGTRTTARGGVRGLAHKALRRG